MISSLITMITPFSCAQSAPKETVVSRNWFKEGQIIRPSSWTISTEFFEKLVFRSRDPFTLRLIYGDRFPQADREKSKAKLSRIEDYKFKIN